MFFTRATSPHQYSFPAMPSLQFSDAISCAWRSSIVLWLSLWRFILGRRRYFLSERITASRAPSTPPRGPYPRCLRAIFWPLCRGVRLRPPEAQKFPCVPFFRMLSAFFLDLNFFSFNPSFPIRRSDGFSFSNQGPGLRVVIPLSHLTFKFPFLLLDTVFSSFFAAAIFPRVCFLCELYTFDFAAPLYSSPIDCQLFSGTKIHQQRLSSFGVLSRPPDFYLISSPSRFTSSNIAPVVLRPRGVLPSPRRMEHLLTGFTPPRVDNVGARRSPLPTCTNNAHPPLFPPNTEYHHQSLVMSFFLICWPVHA